MIGKLLTAAAMIVFGVIAVNRLAKRARLLREAALRRSDPPPAQARVRTLDRDPETGIFEERR